MDLDLNEGQQLLQRAARDFIAKEIPYSRIRELEESATGHSADLWSQMAGLGWLGLPFAADFGGADGDLLDLTVLVAELARGGVATPFITTMLAGLVVARNGSEAQRKALLPRIGAGEAIVTTAIVDPEGGYAVDMVTMAAKETDGGYTLSGTKLFVEYGNVANIILVAARANDGVSFFIVPRDAAGVTEAALPVVGGDRQSELTLANVKVGEDARIDGEAAVREALDLGAALLSVQMQALAQRALDMTVEYAGMRVQFGRPIGAFQAVQHHIANMVIQADAARLISYETMWKLAEGTADEDAIAYAKILTSDAAREVTMTAHQIHGGIGFMKEYDLQFYSRLAAGAALRFGTPDAHYVTIERALGLLD